MDSSHACAPPTTDVPQPALRTRDVMPLLVCAAAVLVAVVMYDHFLHVSRYFWTGTGHDRHAHYYIGLRLAADVKEGRVVEAVRDVLFGSGVWGPLHGTLLAGVLLVGGFDHRLAVLPSLAGFVAAALFGFLAARRCVSRGGNVAGLVAALFILASPAHRAFGTDIMLESLGACLSLMVLYFYLAAIQDASKWAWRGLALTLTALFFHKSNYYTLMAMALVAAEIASRPRYYGQVLRDLLHDTDWTGGLRAQLRRPLNYVLAVLLLVVGMVWLRGNTPWTIGQHSIRIYPPYNIMTIAYAVFFLQLAGWWWRYGRDESQHWDLCWRQLTAWHVAPLLVSFLLPGHIKDFLSYLSRDHGQDGYHHPWLGGLPFYSDCLAHDYHLGLWSMVLAVGLLVIALVACRTLRPGAGVVVACVLIAGLLTCYHPSHRSRFLHSWIAAIWVLSGVGVVQLVYGRLFNGWERVQPWLAGAAVGGLALVQVPGMLQPSHAPEAGPLTYRASWLDVTDAYLPELAQSRRVTILSSVPLIRFLADWTFLERYPQRSRLENHWFGFGPPGDANCQNFAQWLRTTSCDTLVFVERLPGQPDLDFTLPDYLVHEQLLEVLRQQRAFQPVESWQFPQVGCNVRIWRRGGNDLSEAGR